MIMEALPPAPVDLLSPPPDGASTFEPPPLAVLPGDDLTRFILRDPPHPSSSSSSVNNNNSNDDVVNRPSPSPRMRKKSRSGKGGGGGGGSRGANDAIAEDDNDEDHPVLLPPKIGTGLVVIRKENDRPSRGVVAASADDDPLRRPPPSSVVVCIRATVAGRLVYRHSSRTWYVASNPRRYHPTRSPLSSSSLAGMSSSSSAAAAEGGRIAIANVGVGDRVIGIIEDQRASADYYRVNVFGSHPALLHVLGFEGATKRNRPTLEPGSLVYCRVVGGFGGGRMDGEVSCKVGGGGGDCGKSTYNCNRVDDNHHHDYYYDDDDDGGAARKDWMTNEGTYGPLVGGTSFRVPLGLARELLLPKNAVLDALDKSGVPFEIAVGTNGVVWVNGPEPRITIMIVNAIKNSEVMAEDLVRGMVKVMVKNVKKESDDLM